MSDAFRGSFSTICRTRTRGSILLGSRVDMGVGLELGLGLELPCDTAPQRGPIKPKNMKLTNNMNVLSFIACRLVPWICSGYLTPQ
jgi:hypothetical protein